MEAGFMTIVFVAVGIAFTLGLILGCAARHKSEQDAQCTQGTIYIARDESIGKAYPFLESNIPMDKLATMRKATFDVKTIGQNSHK
jgi:hypothetical protein